MSFAMEPYLALLLIGFLPSEVWRWLGIVLGRGLDENSEIIMWVRAVATALVAAVVARITLFPPGALAAVPVEVRLAALAWLSGVPADPPFGLCRRDRRRGRADRRRGGVRA